MGVPWRSHVRKLLSLGGGVQPFLVPPPWGWGGPSSTPCPQACHLNSCCPPRWVGRRRPTDTDTGFFSLPGTFHYTRRGALAHRLLHAINRSASTAPSRRLGLRFINSPCPGAGGSGPPDSGRFREEPTCCGCRARGRKRNRQLPHKFQLGNKREEKLVDCAG